MMKKVTQPRILNARPIYRVGGSMNLVKRNVSQTSPGLGRAEKFLSKHQKTLTIIVVCIVGAPFLAAFVFMLVSLVAGKQFLAASLAIVVALLLLGVIVFYVGRSFKRSKRIENIKAHRRYSFAAVDHSWSDASKATAGTAASVERMAIYQGVKEERSPARVYSQIIDDILVAGQPELPPSITGEQIRYWFYDVQIDVYQNTEHDTRKSGESYYTVLEMKLRRAVPHLILDSKVANKQQFKSIYASRQKLDALAPLQEFFTVYAPQYHAVDTLSFITPEVIEAMIEIRECDLEFVGDSLFCYAPLLDGNEMANLRRSGFLLHSKVNDNLPKYSSKIVQVEPFAQQLLLNPWRSWPAAAILALMTVSGLLAGNWVFVVIAGAAAGGLVYNMMRILRKNKRLTDSFLKKRQSEQ